MDEVKDKVAQGEDKKRLRELIEDKLNVMNELKGNSKEEVSQIFHI